MAKKRILVVDDSCLYQRLLTDVINEHDDLDVVGVAANGRIALEMMSSVQPDLVTLDILMPEMDGIQTLIELRKNWPKIKTIMISSLTSEGSDAALDALALGASDYSVKPVSGGGIEQIRKDIGAELLPKIKALCGLDDVQSSQSKSHFASSGAPNFTASESIARQPGTGMQPRIVAIGVSTGGPDALAKVLGRMPADFEVPIVIVQHMPAQFTSKLAGRLDTSCALKVREAKLGDKIRAGTVYIAPGDYHMTLDKIGGEVIVNLNRDEPENSCRPSVDPLFRSLPDIYGSQVLGVIMTGMGSDGLNGCKVLAELGSSIIVQDKQTSVVWGMPRLVSLAGLAEAEFPLDQLADAMIHYVRGDSNRADKGHAKTGKAANADNYLPENLSGRRT